MATLNTLGGKILLFNGRFDKESVCEQPTAMLSPPDVSGKKKSTKKRKCATSPAVSQAVSPAVASMLHMASHSQHQQPQNIAPNFSNQSTVRMNP